MPCLLPSLLQGKMVGKRPRQMQRTVSVSMMGPESILSEFPMLPEYPKEKQNPHVEVPACYLHGKSIVSNNNPDSDPENAHLFISHVESEACYAEHVLPFASEANHSRPRPWEIREDGAVGLSIVAALHGIDPDITTCLKDSRDETSPTAVMTNTLVHQNLLPSVHQFWTSLTPTAQQQQQQQHHEMELQGHFCGHVTAVSGSLRGAVPNVSPEVHFLEVCCYCRRRLSHGRDIYMYRGDEAFCSEECRHQQILIDERQKKCSLTALKGRTAAQPAHPAGQQSQAMANGTAAAG